MESDVYKIFLQKCFGCEIDQFGHPVGSIYLSIYPSTLLSKVRRYSIDISVHLNSTIYIIKIHRYIEVRSGVAA